MESGERETQEMQEMRSDDRSVPPTPRSPSSVSLELRGGLERLFESDERLQRRLTRAATSVEIRIGDDPAASLTLLLDRFPPRIGGTGEPAEVVVAFTVDQAARFARGELNLPCEVVTGRVGFCGPVRRFLAVDPVLRDRLGSTR